MTAADVAYDFVPVFQRVQTLPKLGTTRRRIVLDLEALGFLQTGNRGSRPYRMPGIGIARADSALTDVSASNTSATFPEIITAPKGK